MHEKAEKKIRLFSSLSMLFLVAFVCGVGSYNQLERFVSLHFSMLEAIMGVICLFMSILFHENESISKSRSIVYWLFPLIIIIITGMYGLLQIDYLLYFIIFIIYLQWGSSYAISFDCFYSILFMFGLIVAISVYLDYFKPDLINRFYNYYTIDVTTTLMELRNNNYTSGITIQPAYASMYLAAALGIAAFIIKIKTQIKTLLLLFLIVALALTNKRTAGIVALAAYCFVFLITKKEKSRIHKRAITILFTVGIIYLIFSTFSSLFDAETSRFLVLFEKGTSVESVLSRRNDLWQLSLEIFVSNPIIGSGWGTISSITAQWRDTTTSLATHNIYLQLLAETGLIGALFFLYPFFSEFAHSIHCLRRSDIRAENIRHLEFATFWEIFFLLYGLTGNPIYDLCPLCLFVVSVMIMKQYGITDRAIEYQGVPELS